MKKLLFAIMLLMFPLLLSAQYTYIYQGPSGSVFDDGSGPDNYADNTNTTYLIIAPESCGVNLSFPEFNTEGGCDKVYVYDGLSDNSRLIGVYDNNTPRPDIISSSGQFMFIRFVTDGNNNLSGWTAQYTYKNVYKENFAAGYGNFFSAIGYHEDFYGLESTYVIKPDGAKRVSLTFPKFNLSPDDVVYVYDGEDVSARLLKQYDYYNRPQATDEVNSTGGSLCVFFTTNTDIGAPRWTAQYKSFSDNYLKPSVSSAHNFTYTLSPQVPIKDFCSKDIDANPDNFAEEIAYTDGLGRPSQKVLINNSPSHKDLVTPTVYDDYGRESIKFLSYTNPGSGAFDENVPKSDLSNYTSTTQSVFYQTTANVANDVLPYAVTQFEDSPLQRVLKQGAPGKDWQPDQHPISFDYLVNDADEVKLWYVDSDGNYKSDVNYGAGELLITQTTDESKNPVKEYKDKSDRVVLKSVYDGSNWLKTYNVYDDFGLLRYVIPPLAGQELDVIAQSGSCDVVSTDKAVSAYEGKSYMIKSGATLTLSPGFSFSGASGSFSATKYVETSDPAAVKDQLVYQYTYDEKHRMITKKLPGAQPIYMVYDNRDRLVLAQDGKMRKENANQWLFIKYDEQNRPLYTGVTTISNKTFDDLRSDFTNYETVFGEVRTNSGTIGYSTDKSFASIFSTSENNILTVTYYDNYDFLPVDGFSKLNFQSVTGYASVKFDRVQGQTTGSKVKILDGGEYTLQAKWMSAVNYFDDNYRPIQSQRTLYDGANGTETASNLYDFTGKLLQSKISQTFNSNPTTVEKYLKYDQAGRLTMVEQKINNGDKVAIAAMTYNELGQLVNKKLGKASSASDYAQSVGYTYNIRGWLTQINNPDNLGANLFGMRLRYNDVEPGLSNSALFNGNISAMVWRNNKQDATQEKAYVYNYDNLDRLSAANFKQNNEAGWDSKTEYAETDITYDANGNISHLTRTYPAKADDNYNYHYNGNQLQHFEGVSLDYIYDDNGNTTFDGLRKFSISYNLLDLPSCISKEGSGKLSYIYTADGEKLAKLVNGSFKQYYAGGMVYNDAKGLDYVLHNEGMARRVTDDNFTYYYNLTDHLGSTRVVFTAADNIAINQQTTEYYPFGLAFKRNNTDINKYLYNGKELQDETIGSTDLGEYDYGARYFDPQIGRFTGIDPICEAFRYVTPYNYTENDPVGSIDLWGLQKLKIATSFTLTTGKVGLEGNVGRLKVGGSYANGAYSQTIMVYFEIENGKLNFGISQIAKNIDNATSVGYAYLFGEESKDKATTRDLSFRNGARKITEKVFTRKENAGFLFKNISTGSDNVTKAEIAVNALLLGVETNTIIEDIPADTKPSNSSSSSITNSQLLTWYSNFLNTLIPYEFSKGNSTTSQSSFWKSPLGSNSGAVPCPAYH
ncbi:MAG: DUF6443 domain-containing protein [Bacteroidota bacterium]|nr:DUF6443 domain-containing protein [Bacteroidota bacterium]